MSVSWTAEQGGTHKRGSSVNDQEVMPENGIALLPNSQSDNIQGSAWRIGGLSHLCSSCRCRGSRGRQELQSLSNNGGGVIEGVRGLHQGFYGPNPHRDDEDHDQEGNGAEKFGQKGKQKGHPPLKQI